MANKPSNVVLNFKMSGQVQYAQTIREINSVMNTAAKEYKNHVAAMGDDAKATEKLTAEKKKLEIQMEAARKRTELLRAQYNAMSKDTKTTTGQLTQMYSKLLDAERAELSLQKSLDKVNDGLSDQAQTVRDAEGELSKLADEMSMLESEQKKLSSSFELQNASLAENADETLKVELAQKQLQQQMKLTSRVLGNLENQLDQAKKAYGENSREANELEAKLNQARLTVAKFNRSLESVEDSSKEAKRGLEGVKGALGVLATAASTAAIGGLVSGMQETNQQLAMLEMQAKNAGSGLNNMYKQTKKMRDEDIADLEAGLGRQENVMAKSLDKKLNAIEKSHDQQKESLEKTLEKEYEATADTYEKQEVDLEKALEKEYEALEKAADKKIALIDKEYTEKLKLIDEERYKQIKSIESQIENLNALSDAENKALEEKENADRRAELKARFDAAKTSKERQEALKDLSDFDERIRLKKIQEERKTKIDSFKQEKDAINESFEVKKESLKEEYEARKEATKNELDENLKLVKESHESELEAVRELNQEKLEQLKEEQDQRKKLLDERLTTEMEAIKAAHDDELESFKQMNEKKVEIAKNPVEIESQIQQPDMNVKVGFDISEIEQARVALGSVGHDVNQTTETVGNLIQAGYDTADSINQISEALAGARIKYGETFNAEGLAESITTTTQLGEVTGQLMDLLEKEGVNIDGFNNKMQSMGSATERANYITQLLASKGLNGMYQEYAKANPEIVKYTEAQIENQQALAELAVVLTPLITQVAEFTTELIKWANENPILTKGIATGTVAIGGMIAVIGTLAPLVSNIINLFGGKGGGLGKTLIGIASRGGPIGLVVAAVGGLIAIGVALYKNWDTVKEKANQLKEKLGNLFKGIKWEWPKIKLPHFKLEGKFDFDPLDGDGLSVPKIKVDWRANGAIFTQPTIFGMSNGRLQGAGEAGPEAVLPLNESTLGKIGEGIARTMRGSGVTVQQMIVRDDTDIKLVARELFNLQESRRRAAGRG